MFADRLNLQLKLKDLHSLEDKTAFCSCSFRGRSATRQESKLHGDQHEERRKLQRWSEWARTVVLGELAVARAIAGDSIRIDPVLHSNDHGDDELSKQMKQSHLHLKTSGEGDFSYKWRRMILRTRWKWN